MSPSSAAWWGSQFSPLNPSNNSFLWIFPLPFLPSFRQSNSIQLDGDLRCGLCVTSNEFPDYRKAEPVGSQPPRSHCELCRSIGTIQKRVTVSIQRIAVKHEKAGFISCFQRYFVQLKDPTTFQGPVIELVVTLFTTTTRFLPSKRTRPCVFAASQHHSRWLQANRKQTVSYPRPQGHHRQSRIPKQQPQPRPSRHHRNLLRLRRPLPQLHDRVMLVSSNSS